MTSLLYGRKKQLSTTNCFFAQKNFFIFVMQHKFALPLCAGLTKIMLEFSLNFIFTFIFTQTPFFLKPDANILM